MCHRLSYSFFDPVNGAVAFGLTSGFHFNVSGRVSHPGVSRLFSVCVKVKCEPVEVFTSLFRDLIYCGPDSFKKKGLMKRVDVVPVRFASGLFKAALLRFLNMRFRSFVMGCPQGLF